MKLYNSTTEIHFSNNILIIRHLDPLPNISIKCQKNTIAVENGLFQPIFATNYGSKAQKRGQNPSQNPSIYIFTNDAAQLGMKAYSPTSLPRQSTKETPTERNPPLPPNHHLKKAAQSKIRHNPRHIPINKYKQDKWNNSFQSSQSFICKTPPSETVPEEDHLHPTPDTRHYAIHPTPPYP